MLGDNAGRRRITQLSKDEWRAALGQQIAEKQQNKQKRRDTSPESGSSSAHVHDAGNRGNQERAANATPPSDSQPEVAWGRSLERAVRRGVQQMSNEEWRQALEQQIQTKKQQKEQDDPERGARDRTRANASAPTTETNDEMGVFANETAAVCVPPLSANEVAAIVGGRRRVTTHMSQEEYLKSVQEQIEQKRQAKAREKALSAESPVKNIAKVDPQAAETAVTPPTAESIATPSILKTQKQDLDVWKPVDPGSDPIAIATIVSFYEELKKQNEDVKLQLVEQHSVLASLQSRLVVAAAAASLLTVESTSNPTEERSRAKSLEVRVAGARPIRATALRPRVSRGDSKIPLPPSVETPVAKIRDSIPLVEKSLSGNEIAKAVEVCTTAKQQDEEVVAKQEEEEKRPHDNTDPTSRQSMIHNQDKLEIPQQEAQDGLDYSIVLPSRGPSNQNEEIDASLHEHNIAEDVDVPMAGNSELVAEITDRISLDDGELLSCTSMCVYDGPSSLVALNTSICEIFRSSR